MTVSPYFTIYSCGTTVSADRQGDIGRAMLVQYDENQEDSLVLHGVGSPDTIEVINDRFVVHNTPGINVIDSDGSVIRKKKYRRVDGSTLEKSGYILGTGEEENIKRSLCAINNRLEALRAEAQQTGEIVAPLTVNLVGFSRGAVQNIKLTNAVYEKFGSAVRLNILCIDPVAGPLRHNEIDKNVFPPTVDHVYITFATEENNRYLLNRGIGRYEFLNDQVKVHTCPLPGGHNHQILGYTDIQKQMLDIGKNILKSNKTAWKQLKKLASQELPGIYDADEEEMIAILKDAASQNNFTSLNDELIQQIVTKVVQKRAHPSQLQTARIVHEFLLTHGDPIKRGHSLTHALDNPEHRIHRVLTPHQTRMLLQTRTSNLQDEDVSDEDEENLFTNAEYQLSGVLELVELHHDPRVFVCSNYTNETENTVVNSMKTSSFNLHNRDDLKNRDESSLVSWRHSRIFALKHTLDTLSTNNYYTQKIRSVAYYLLRQMLFEHRKITNEYQLLAQHHEDFAGLDIEFARCRAKFAALDNLADKTVTLLEQFNQQQNGVGGNLQQKLDDFKHAAEIHTVGRTLKRASAKFLAGIYATLAGLFGFLLCSGAYLIRCVSAPKLPSSSGFGGAAGLGFYDYFITAYERRTSSMLNQKKEHACRLEKAVESGIAFFQPESGIESQTQQTQEENAPFVFV